jgi:hypothetical protein
MCFTKIQQKTKFFLDNTYNTVVIRMSVLIEGFELMRTTGINDMGNGYSKTPHYNKWTGMYSRCYSPKSHSRAPTYKDCYVCVKWRWLSNFYEWMDSLDWEGKQLDKDLLGDTYEYSPDNCCFISRELNNLIEPRGVPVDMSNATRERVASLMLLESDPRVIEALKARYAL